jgi:hypothetical protein
MATRESTDQPTAQERPDEGADAAADRRDDRPPSRSRRGERSGGLRPALVARNARRQLGALLGRQPDGVSALRRTDQGWAVSVEVVELERVPDTTSVLATYLVELDEAGELIGYERQGRYTRGQVNR